MANFNYNRGIPDGPNNPSVDQPKMKINTNSTYDILEVDHETFLTDNGGTHKQVTFYSNNAPGALDPEQSVIYTDNGVADPTHPQLYWNNTLLASPLSAIRAFATFTSAAGAIAIDNGFNVVSITGANIPPITATITLEADAVQGNNVAVFVFASNQGSSSPTYNFVNPVLTVTNLPSNRRANILVLQV